MLDIEYCRKILEKGGKKYTDEQIIEIRKYLYQFAKWQIKDLENGQYDKIILDSGETEKKKKGAL